MGYMGGQLRYSVDNIRPNVITAKLVNQRSEQRRQLT